MLNGKKQPFYRREVFIIQDAPRDPSKLMDIVFDNERKLPINKKQVEIKYGTFHRFYYKESGETPFDFKDDPGGFSTNVITDHDEDFVCRIDMDRIDWNLPYDSLTYTWTSTCNIPGDTIISRHE